MPFKFALGLSWLALSSCALSRVFPPIGNCFYLNIGDWQCVDATGKLIKTPPLTSLIAFPEAEWASYDRVCHK